MAPRHLGASPDDSIPLNSARRDEANGDEDEEDDDDLDANGLVIPSSSHPLQTTIQHQLPARSSSASISPTLSSVPHSSNASPTRSRINISNFPINNGDDAWHYMQARFAHAWRRVPVSWSLERDPTVAFRHILTLLGFVSLCIFVFSVPYILYLVSPRAPTPPGTAPPLDEAASTVSGKHGAVAADVPRCSDVGIRIMKDLGGNSIDAAISTVLCQGVLAPFASGLGGGAFILVHKKSNQDDIGVSRLYDSREVAPAAASFELFSQNASLAQRGGLSVAIPGELRGLYTLHTDFGHLPWRDIVMPVVEVAQTAKVGKFLAAKLKLLNETVLSSPSLANLFTKKVLTSKGQNQQDAAASAELPGVRRSILSILPKSGRNESDAIKKSETKDKHTHKDENAASIPKLTSGGNGGAPTTGTGTDNETYVIEVLKEGDDLKNDALVATLRSIAEHGPDALYHNLSEPIAHEVRAAGGVLTGRDVRGYTVKKRGVVQSTYQGFTILGAPPPSIGGASIAMALNMITELEFRKKGRNAVSFRLLAESLKWVFGAAMGLADPSFVPSTKWQLRSMLSRREAMRRAYRIDPSRTFRPSRYAPGVSTSMLNSGTSHVSVVDVNGSAVSISSSINLPFGAQFASSIGGFVFNDAMHAFTTRYTRPAAYDVYPTRENAVQAGKRPASAVCPTIVMRGRRVYLVVGSSGGPKAITGVLQTLLNVLDFGDPLADAISAPRIHHQLVPNIVSFEAVNVSTCELTDHLRRPSDAIPGAQQKGFAYWSSVCEGLKEVGHQLEGPDVHGAVQAVLVPAALSDADEDKTIYAASDHRRIGKAAAY